MFQKKLLSIIVLFFTFSFIPPIEKGTQRALYECSPILDISTKNFNLKTKQIQFQFDKSLNPTKDEAKNFIWLKKNLNQYFIGYLINTTSKTYTIERQDRSLIMIQEALNESGEWMPIEYWVYSGCGNSYFNPLKLAPNKYVMIPIKKYTGSFKTKIRLKLRNGKKTIYSQTFEGNIDKTQFNKEKQTVNGILYQGNPSYLEKKR